MWASVRVTLGSLYNRLGFGGVGSYYLQREAEEATAPTGLFLWCPDRITVDKVKPAPQDVGS